MTWASQLGAQEPGQQGAQQAAWLLLTPALLVACGAFQGLMAILFPRWTAVTRRSIEERRWASVGWGAAIAVLAFLLLAAGSSTHGVLAGMAALVAVLVTVAGALGLVGAAAAVGARLLPGGLGEDDRAPLQSLVGGLALAFASLVPVLGQVLAVLVSLAALGAAAQALVTGVRFATPPPEETES